MVNAAQEKRSRKPIQTAEDTVSSPLSFVVAGGDGVGGESFLPLSLDSDAIADTIKSFFSYNLSQDLHISLQSFQSSIFHHNSAVFSGHSHLSFNAAAPRFSEQSERIVSCDMEVIASNGGDGGGYDYSVANLQPTFSSPFAL